MYLDIEMNSWGQITVLGLYGHGGFTSLVQGESLTRQRVCEELAQYDLLVTFNGTSFDLPVLLASIQGLPLNQPHVDLCLLGRQLGYRGGLKTIELQLGIQRRADLWGMSGADAGQLWNRWRHSRDEEARERLLAYNEADCVNLQPLADLFYCRMVQQCRGDDASPSPCQPSVRAERGLALTDFASVLPVSALLVGRRRALVCGEKRGDAARR